MNRWHLCAWLVGGIATVWVLRDEMAGVIALVWLLGELLWGWPLLLLVMLGHWGWALRQAGRQATRDTAALEEWGRRIDAYTQAGEWDKRDEALRDGPRW